MPLQMIMRAVAYDRAEDAASAFKPLAGLSKPEEW